MYYFGLYLPYYYRLDPELLPGSGSGTRKIQSWIRIQNKSFRIHNTEIKCIHFKLGSHRITGCPAILLDIGIRPFLFVVFGRITVIAVTEGASTGGRRLEHFSTLPGLVLFTERYEFFALLFQYAEYGTSLTVKRQINIFHDCFFVSIQFKTFSHVKNMSPTYRNRYR